MLTLPQPQEADNFSSLQSIDKVEYTMLSSPWGALGLP